MRFLLWFIPSLLSAQTYDVVLQRGRVIDPESGRDGVYSIAIKGTKIVAISTRPLRGKVEVDATGLVVDPGFIDLHSHGQTPENYRYKTMDGVTTALELEIGVSPVSEWYAARNGKALVNFGASSGHIPAAYGGNEGFRRFHSARFCHEATGDSGRTEGHRSVGSKRNG